MVIIENKYQPEDEERYKEFTRLREKVNDNIDKETAERIKRNPKPTEEELRIGAFSEMLESQVRKAIFGHNSIFGGLA